MNQRYNRTPIKRALLIGIDYINTPIRLFGCINDINTIRQHIITKCNYSPINIRTMTDTGFKPTKNNIINAIDWFVSNLQPGDTLFFHYSGHGTSIIDRNNDEIDGRDEGIVPLDYTTSGIILDDVFYTKLIQRIPTGVTLYGFFDCCHSGTMVDIKYNIKHIVQPKIPITQLITSYIDTNWHNNYVLSIEGTREVSGNVFIFSGCLDNQLASETVNKDSQIQGAFTQTLLETLISNNNNIKIIDLNKELNCRLTYNGYKNQNSQLSFTKLELLDHTIKL
jgi:hypothetical protein